MDPPSRRHLLHHVARLLNIRLQNGNHRSVLLCEELLCHRTAFLAHANLLGVDQQGLHILVATTASHVRDRKEGAGLGPSLTPVRLEAGLVAHVGIGINGDIVVSVALARINQKFVHGGRIHAGGIGHQIGCRVSAWAHRLGIIRLDAAQVISGMRHSVDVHVHETLWRTSRKKENQIDDLSDQTLLFLYQTSPE